LVSFARRRVILFFWPMGASSANQISIALPPVSAAIAAKTTGSLFKSSRRSLVLRTMTRPRRELAVSKGPHRLRIFFVALERYCSKIH
jgi:hypothetical protein